MTAHLPTPNYQVSTTVTPYVIRPGRGSVRTTYQLAAELLLPDGATIEVTFADAASVALNWLAAKFPEALPAAARQLESFELDHHGLQLLNCVSIPEDGLWSVRLVQPDAPYKERPAVAGRTWTTELALQRGNGGIHFGVRVMCASAPYATEPITLTRPRIVIDMANRCGLQEIRPIDGQPWELETEDDLQSLYNLLTHSARTLPVILLTQPAHQQLQVPVADYMLDHRLLARRTQGFAHVVCMPTKLGFAWTEMVSKVWSAFFGAVRTYQPNLDFDNDSPFVHPLMLPDRILFWRYNGLEGEDAFASFLIDKVQAQAATKYVNWGNSLFFADARSRRAALTRERIQRELERQFHADEAATFSTQVRELKKAHDEEIEALKAKIGEAQKDAEEFDILATQYKQLEEQSSRENHRLQVQNDALRAAIVTRIGHSPDSDLSPPDTYHDMADWVEEHLTGRLILHPRALQGIKDATFEDVGAIYKSLQLLADEYRNMRLGTLGARESWEEGLKRLELQFSGSITKERAGEQGETYFVRYPTGTNQRRLLDLHLRKGTTRDNRYCMRIYFFWDENRQRVVVGWLPSHLETRAT